MTASRLRSTREHIVLAAVPVLSSYKGESLTTIDQIVAMAKIIWPTAKAIEVKPYKADPRSSWSGSDVAEGFKLTIFVEGGSLVAQIIAGSLEGLKTKLEQRSRKRRFGSA